MPEYRRILLKLSGEALMGGLEAGIDPVILHRLAGEIKALIEYPVQLALVIGGGNIFRGAGLAEHGMNRVTGDYMGMLATVMNSLAMSDALKQQGITAHVVSAISMDSIAEVYQAQQVDQYLEQGDVVIFAAGTGNPFFTTDSAASLRAIEISADLLIKATKVNGIFSADPVKDPNAEFYPRLSYDQVLAGKLAVMDLTAIVLCQQHQLPLRVMNIYQENALYQLLQGQDIGSLVMD